MKKIYFLLFIILIVLISNLKLLSQCNNCEYLAISDPKATWKFSYSSIDEATIVVKPAGMFYLYDVYLTYNSVNPNYKSVYDTFEVQHYFTLPENALIVDSWLWVDDQIMKAQILDRSTAFNIYEGIVNRRRDPSILYKNSPTNYEFRIFPIPYGKKRKVKLSIMLPAFIDNGITKSTLPIQIIKKSMNIPKVNIIVYEKDCNNLTALSTGNTFTAHNDEVNGNYVFATILPNTIENNPTITIEHETFKSDEVSLFVTQDSVKTDEGIYQLYVNPVNLFKPNTQNRKAAIVIDHNSNFSVVGKYEMLNQVRNFITKEFTNDDEIRIYYNKLESKEATNGWTKISDINFDNLFNEIQVGNTSILIPSLFKVYTEVKDQKEAEVYLFSSDASITTAVTSQQLKNELYQEFGELNKTFVLNYVSTSKSYIQIYYNNYSYNGNELFYKILTNNTGGGSVNINNFYQNISFEEGLNQLIQLKSESTYDNFQYYLKPELGICYDNYIIKNANGYLQVGKYKGSGDFKIEYYFIEEDNLVSENLTLIKHEVDKKHEVALSHSGLKIQFLERSSIPHEQDLAIELSLKNRVLSYNTAFLALEPSVQEPCFDCEAEDDVLIATEDENDDAIALSAYPNPFTFETIITLKNASNSDLISDIALYTLEGKKINITYQIEKMDSSLQIKMNGDELVKGIYLLKINYNGKIYILKLIKI